MNTEYPALTAAFLRYQHELHQFLLRQINCPDSAADLLHDTFLHIAQYPAQAQVINQRAFLYRVASNLAVDYLRIQVRRQEREKGALDEDWPCQRPQPERFVESRQQLLVAEAWLRGLPLPSRQIVYLRRLEGKSHRQIASELQVTTSHVEHSLRRSQKSLAEAMIEQN
jgi:RNA polymerase sigma-70 factor (ECF subfamily)